METILYNNQKPGDGKFRTDYCCDKPSFSDLLWRDFCMQNAFFYQEFKMNAERCGFLLCRFSKIEQ